MTINEILDSKTLTNDQKIEKLMEINTIESFAKAFDLV